MSCGAPGRYSVEAGRWFYEYGSKHVAHVLPASHAKGARPGSASLWHRASLPLPRGCFTLMELSQGRRNTLGTIREYGRCCVKVILDFGLPV
ncbi:hypothetical protein PoB_005694000 [Plakobranchus ocellatus]|uniref:Uncharacterized protein n=1 Tax=Plakobranchus ocellatus TaxID=259542 RepID=A0AAV4CG11_9GAST|nr:hypothetical protein PoB_005694000 [Plakobranchus ocellatus]